MVQFTFACLMVDMHRVNYEKWFSMTNSANPESICLVSIHSAVLENDLAFCSTVNAVLGSENRSTGKNTTKLIFYRHRCQSHFDDVF